MLPQTTDTNICEWLMNNVSTIDVGYKARMVRVNGQHIALPESDFITLAIVIDKMFAEMNFDGCVITPTKDIQPLIKRKLSTQQIPTAAMNRIMKHGIFKCERIATKPLFVYRVSMCGAIGIDNGILSIG